MVESRRNFSLPVKSPEAFVHTWRIENWSQKILEAKVEVLQFTESDLLYVPPGYHLYLGAYANHPDTSYLPVFLYAKEGDFDGSIKWPFPFLNGNYCNSPEWELVAQNGNYCNSPEWEAAVQNGNCCNADQILSKVCLYVYELQYTWYYIHCWENTPFKCPLHMVTLQFRKINIHGQVCPELYMVGFA